VSLFSEDFSVPLDVCSELGRLEAMLTERAISIIGIILGSSLVAVAIAGEVTDCQTSVTREAGDLAHWSWRTIDGKQCWYRGARWKPKHELRWAEMTPSATPSAGQPETDNRTDGLGAESGRLQPDRPPELSDLDAGPTAPTSTDNAPEEWRAQFADLWPEAFELTGNVELRDARPDVRPAQSLWPIVFLPLALLVMWHLVRVKGGSSRAFGSHGRASLRT
jgi:hypothetical protein